MADSGKKEDSNSDHITLRVLGQDNALIDFKLKKIASLAKLMTIYCQRANLSLAAVRFRFDGEAINEKDTPLSLGLEDGDTIEAYTQQTGGISSAAFL